MIGLMILLFFAVYLAVTIWITTAAVGWAKRTNRKPWLWGGLTAFVMYNLVFWDFIPTLVAHKYYCETQAGFWVYKTPEQWKKENPEGAETLTSRSLSDSYKIEKVNNGFKTTYYVNQRIRASNTISRVLTSLLNTQRNEFLLIDSKTNSVLTRRISFSAGRTSGAPNSLADLKFWVNLKECGGGNGNVTQMVWGAAENSFRNIGEKK